MSAMMFAYVQSRQLEIELEVERRDQADAMSMRDRLGRTLIPWGEQLVALPRSHREQRRRFATPPNALWA